MKYDTYRSHVPIPFGELSCQTKIQHEARMAAVWRTTHGKIGLEINDTVNKNRNTSFFKVFVF